MIRPIKYGMQQECSIFYVSFFIKNKRTDRLKKKKKKKKPSEI